MKGVSEVIAIILILMITISLAGLAYMFMSTTMSDVTASAGSTVETTTSSMLTSFAIESIDAAKVYIRNTGQGALTGLTVYVDDELAIYNLTPVSIAAGSVGTITIYSFIPDGATVKVTSPSGFSVSKLAHPCENAVSCWKFDEGTGTTTYDSSPYGNSGRLVNGTSWTSGRYSNGLRFDGTDDSVNISNPGILEGYDAGTFSAWFKGSSKGFIYSLTNAAAYNNFVFVYVGDITGQYADESIGFGVKVADSSVLEFYVRNGHTYYLDNMWHYVTVITGNGDNSIYVDGVRQSLTFRFGIASTNEFSDLSSFSAANFGVWKVNNAESYYFNGTLDEVRIYNRIIY